MASVQHSAASPLVSEADDRARATPDERVAALTAELAALERRLVESESAARKRIAMLTEALAAIEQSPSWRLTAPLRRLGAALPPHLQNRLFGVARALYWVATPHKLPQRLRWMSYAPVLAAAVARVEQRSAEARRRLGPPLRRAYGASAVEQLDIYRTSIPNAPIFLFVHGGAWREGEAKNYAFPAELFVAAGAHYVALDFIAVREAGGDVTPMAEQVRRGIAWVAQNAASFGGDPARLYLAGHSSGAHLCAVALSTDWRRQFGLAENPINAALLMSGVYDMGPMRRSGINPYLRFTDAVEEAMSPIRHLDRIATPVVVTYGSGDSPDFRQQSRDFAAALRNAGKPVEIDEANGFGHMEMLESLGDPAGPNGRAALAMMQLDAPP